MSKLRVKSDAGYIDTSKLAKGENGRALCRWCTKEVPKGRRSYCSDQCVHEWKIRSQPGYARRQVEMRDKGVCSKCLVDTEAIESEGLILLCRLHESRTGQLHTPRRMRYISLVAFAVDKQHSDWLSYCERYRLKPGHDPTRTLWHMDHVKPVVEGGGECGLENLRTLCIPCHKEETAQLRKRMAEARKLAKANGNLGSE